MCKRIYYQGSSKQFENEYKNKKLISGMDSDFQVLKPGKSFAGFKMQI
jgi:hypothetical protein